jgi:glucosamine-6-phosphate deaminase
MPIKVYVANDFSHMSSAAASIVGECIANTLATKKEAVLGLATGNTPTGLYRQLAAAANAGKFDSGRIRTFNLDEYIGLPGENAQQRVLHPESYSRFMIANFFSLLKTNLAESSVPYGCLIDQNTLAQELAGHPDDWQALGVDAGKSIAIRPDAASKYLAWVRNEVLDRYEQKIAAAGGIDLQIIGAGGKGHVAFHESGIPFEGSRVMLVKLDDNTVENAITDGHFKSKADSPWYATSMGVELVYEAKTIVLLANGTRKAGPVAESLLGDPTPNMPISYGQIYARNGGNLIYILEKVAAKGLTANIQLLKNKGISIEIL